MENDQFKFSFINIYCDLMNTVFEYNYISSQLDSITTNIENVIQLIRKDGTMMETGKFSQ